MTESVHHFIIQYVKLITTPSLLLSFSFSPSLSLFFHLSISHFFPTKKRFKVIDVTIFWSRAGDDKRFLESNASSIPGIYFSLGYVKVPRIEKAFDSRNLLPPTALDPTFMMIKIATFYF